MPRVAAAGKPTAKISKSQNTKARVLHEALALASRIGFQGLSFGTLAAHARLSKSGLFAHFRSKEDLQIRALELASAMFVERVLKPAVAAPRGVPRIRRLFDGWMAWIRSDSVPSGDIRWFEAKPTYMLHVANAWEEGDEIVMVGTPYRLHQDEKGQPDVARLIHTIRKRQRDFMLYEWRFDLRSGKTRERAIDDVLNSEFPVINSEYAGRKNRWSYHIVFPHGGDEEPRFTGLTKHDLETGGYQAWSEGPALYYNEPGFARADHAQKEDDGYLVSFVWNPLEVRSEIQVFDCRGREFGRGPIARILVPQRVPNGFHATYISRKRLDSGL